jgi:hypothetical protein
MKDDPAPFKKCFKILLCNNKALRLIKNPKQAIRINKNNMYQNYLPQQIQRNSKIIKIYNLIKKR